jgi:hypothetical protein
MLGTGFVVPLIEIFLTHAAGDRAPSIETFMQKLSARNLAIVRDNTSGSPDGTKNEIKQKLAEFRRDRLPIYQRLGVV